MLNLKKKKFIDICLSHWGPLETEVLEKDPLQNNMATHTTKDIKALHMEIFSLMMSSLFLGP